MSYTEAQKKAIEVIFEATKGRDICNESQFKSALQSAKVRAPWALLNKYRKSDNSFELSELYESAIGKSTIKKDKAVVVDPDEDENEDETTEEAEIDNDVEDIAEEISIPATELDSESTEPEKNTFISKKMRDIPDLQRMHFKEAVYLVEAMDASGQTHVVGVARSFRGVWDKLKYLAIHDHGIIDEDQCYYDLETKGVSCFRSRTSSTIKCIITKTELV